MSQLVPVQQAAANALATWLQSRFTDGTVVWNRWAEPDVVLPAKTVTIILAGPRQDEMLDPEVVSSVDAGGNSKIYTYRIRSCLQPLQLDVWATYAPARDDILAQLDVHLNVGESITLGVIPGSPIRNGVLLPLANGWTGYADVWFDAPSYSDSPPSNQAKEYRAILKGQCAIDLLVSATSWKIAQIILKQQLHEAKTAVASTGTDVATITAAGVTYTHTTP